MRMTVAVQTSVWTVVARTQADSCQSGALLPAVPVLHEHEHEAQGRRRGRSRHEEHTRQKKRVSLLCWPEAAQVLDLEPDVLDVLHADLAPPEALHSLCGHTTRARKDSRTHSPSAAGQPPALRCHGGDRGTGGAGLPNHGAAAQHAVEHRRRAAVPDLRHVAPALFI